jgi:glycerophosphoryl diester phosphodiesterase
MIEYQLMHPPVFIAHRGLPELYPENTLLSIEQAIRAGAKAVEFDIQMTMDRVPILFHDTTLGRMTGKAGLVMKKTWEQLREYHASCPDRFARTYTQVAIASLAEAIELFNSHPGVCPCIEIKQESAEYFGLKTFVNAVVKTADPLLDRALFLSFNREVIAYLHSLGIMHTGWALEGFDTRSRVAARELKPEVLVCDINKLPASGKIFWPGPWVWMVYHTEDPVIARRYFEAGAGYVETDNIRHMAASLPEYFIDSEQRT